MLLVMKADGAIDWSADLQPGRNVLGTVQGVLDDTGYRLLAPGTSSSHGRRVEEGLFSGPAMQVDFDPAKRSGGASTDLSGVSDLFYASGADGATILSDDLFALVRQLGAVTIEASTANFFVRHGYFAAGTTLFREVRRIAPGRVLDFGREGQRLREVRFPDALPPPSYAAFKTGLNSALETIGYGAGDSLLLSGGVDSGLLLAILRVHFQSEPRALTFGFEPYDDMNWEDTERARAIGEAHGIPVDVLSLRLDEWALAELDPVVEAMPLTAHLAIPFLRSIRHAAGKGATRVWSGQNADGVYNLGPTGQWNTDVLRRFLISRPYLRSLRGGEGGGVERALARTAGWGIARLFSLARQRRYEQPRTFDELLSAFFESDDGLALRESAGERAGRGAAAATSLAARRALLDAKLGSYLVGRDARVIYTAAALNGMEGVLPYTAANMVVLFREMEMGLRDVVQAKRFIRMYLRELLGAGRYSALYERAVRPRTRVSTASWFNMLLHQTGFGQELKAAVSGPVRRLCTVEPASTEQWVALFWLSRLMERIDGSVTVRTVEAGS